MEDAINHGRVVRLIDLPVYLWLCGLRKCCCIFSYRISFLRRTPNIYNILGAKRGVSGTASIWIYRAGNTDPGFFTPWSGASWPLCSCFWQAVCPATSGRSISVRIKTIAPQSPGLGFDMSVRQNVAMLGLKCQTWIISLVLPTSRIPNRCQTNDHVFLDFTARQRWW